MRFYKSKKIILHEAFTLSLEFAKCEPSRETAMSQIGSAPRALNILIHLTALTAWEVGCCHYHASDQMEQLKHREVKRLAQDHTTRKWQDQGPNSKSDLGIMRLSRTRNGPSRGEGASPFIPGHLFVALGLRAGVYKVTSESSP